MELSLEQQIVFDKYIAGNNIFITGPGGSGKSALIRQIYKHAYSNSKKIYVTALTGCAAVLLNCQAKTLHSWAGIGLGNQPIENLVKKIKNNKFSKELWKTTEILVIDEVSMLSYKLFNILNQIGKILRNNKRPFGGIQVIFSGDFFQLPPVGNADDPDSLRFCFESEDWNTVFHKDNQIQLKKIFRQTDDVYTNILNQIRNGKIKRKSFELLSQYVGREISSDLIVEPTKLFPIRSRVDFINSSKMNLLKGEERKYNIGSKLDLDMSKIEKAIRSEYNIQDIEREINYLASNAICEKEISIKIGAQVMCIVNMPCSNICNGSQGVVTGFCDITGCPRVKYNNGCEIVMTQHIWLSDKIPGVGISQVPLILAWALTIHKSQGATMDTAEIDVGNSIFECGQTYVALSRVKSLEGLYLSSFDVSKIKVNKKVQQFYEDLHP
jgi:ATP-dependent DNA helicase PIF1